jgi:tRNA G10  N-methylase Trm11
MPAYLVRLAQSHESFRRVELQALADVAGVVIDFIKYEEDVGILPHFARLAVFHVKELFWI